MVPYYATSARSPYQGTYRYERSVRTYALVNDTIHVMGMNALRILAGTNGWSAPHPASWSGLCLGNAAAVAGLSSPLVRHRRPCLLPALPRSALEEMNAGVPGLGVCSEAVAHLFRVSQSNNTQVSSWLLLAFCLRSLASSCFNLPPLPEPGTDAVLRLL